MKTLVLVLLTLAVAFGTNKKQVTQGSWMTVPTPRQSTASQTGPCGDATTDNAAVNATAGQYLTVSWIVSTQNTNQRVYLMLLTVPQMTTYRSINNVTFTTGNTNLRIPPDVPAGQYYLQWWWTTYYSCSLLNISADPSGRELVSATQTVQKTVVPPPTYSYFEITLDTQFDDLFLDISGTGPSGLVVPNSHITVVGIEGVLTPPTTTLKDNGADTRNGPNFDFGLCRNNNNEKTFVVGVLAGPNTQPSDVYSITFGTYNPLVNSGQVYTSPAHNGYKYYMTQAYETDVPRRVVLRSDADYGTEIPTFRLARNCEMTTTVITGSQTTSDSMCIQLDNKAGNKYIQVPPVTSGYRLLVETGKCGDIAAAPATVASVILMIALILLVL